MKCNAVKDRLSLNDFCDKVLRCWIQVNRTCYIFKNEYNISVIIFFRKKSKTKLKLETSVVYLKLCVVYSQKPNRNWKLVLYIVKNQIYLLD